MKSKKAKDSGGLIGKRHSSFELYDLLAQCMALAERCRQGENNAELRRLVTQQPTGKRRYVEAGSDEYILVCRFVFSNLRSAGTERSNASRYAHALRQAAKRGLNASLLARWLGDNGGINALFLARPLAAQSVSTKTLYLTESITIPKDRPVQLTLRRLPDNRYEVLRHEEVA